MDGAHIVGVRDTPQTTMPTLVVRDAAGLHDVPLIGPFAWRLSGDRHCVGQWVEGQHVACPTREHVTHDYTCRACSGLENPACVFEPVCASDPSSCTCLASFRGVEHVVYLAFHGILPKVGLTQARRVERRLQEQGADAYFVVQGGLERGAARTLEKSLAYVLGIPEFRTHAETFGALTRPVAWSSIDERAAAWQERLRSHHDVGPLHHVQHPAFLQPLPSRPRLLQAYGEHAGAWLASKGNHVFYAESARGPRLGTGVPVAALRRSDLMGRTLAVLDDAPR